ncbi:MAG: hypothetical protein E7580_03910 [Ruminococcaceae bacterium]|nr:hypothetical protein [Oscillospiraceae bacterium]
MTFSEAARALKIEVFPEEMDEIYENIVKSGEYPFSREMLVHLQEKFNLFEDYYDAVLEGFDDLERDEARRVWSYTVASYAKTHQRKELTALKLPETDLTPAGQMAPLFPLICMAEDSYYEYLRRGFPEEETKVYMRTYRRSMGVTTNRTGKPGLQKSHFDWSSLYAFVEMYNTGGFNFALGVSSEANYVLMHKETREVKVLLNGVVMHRDGMPLGCAGYDDEQGAYTVTFEETDDCYLGYPAVNFRCPNEKQTFSKDKWKLVIAPGDDIFCLHIPRGTDLSPAKVAEAIRSARQIAKRSYPERNIKGIRCTSWLLSPTLNELLGDKSNISNFSNIFNRYPIRNNGNGVFSFAFNGRPADLNDLPEDTSLRRKVKALYLEGGFVLNYGGFIIDEDAPV